MTDYDIDLYFRDSDPAYAEEDPVECLVCGSEIEDDNYCKSCDRTWEQQVEWAQSP